MPHTSVFFPANASVPSSEARVITLRKVPNSIPVIRAALFSVRISATQGSSLALYLSEDLRLAQQESLPAADIDVAALASVFALAVYSHPVLSAVGAPVLFQTLQVTDLDLEVPGDIVGGYGSTSTIDYARIDVYYSYRPATRVRSLAIARRAPSSARGVTRL